MRATCLIHTELIEIAFLQTDQAMHVVYSENGSNVLHMEYILY